ncbi:2Fe-2S iron-sulfur cluster binding domain-containing protein [Azoarcus sp. TTM-91]|uniref:PDR/VanB family oxidoreductase n=1 Tax=Azoarcus sp. TTM-91 TaxID=2691581 RepID=UPI00145FA765|nr:PDR/VanB family oxidoreductase [Azoarcus sp. TTM-91]NMG37311.1 2Fe-2S iron-sulfur cluster binding domain-containing protein [Azoarcus sp. TTM-91]
MNSDTPLRLRVSEFTAEARDVVSIELRAPEGGPLPPFEPGAHLELQLPGGLRRHYSLCNDPRERERYLIAVGRAPASRGGSRHIHQQLRVGDVLTATALRNNFPLQAGAPHYRFIGGGIGITPLLAMIHACEARGAEWSLLYCVRSRSRAAFQEVLARWPQRVSWHADDEHAGRPLDLEAALAAPAEGEQLYCCGPDGLMQAVRKQAAAHATGWAPEQLHFEWFSAPTEAPASMPAQAAAGPRPFQLVLRQQGISLEVPAHLSILETLEANGLALPCACREGLCRTCETAVCAGEVEHRDYVLSEAERAAGKSMMICVSRARGEVLELDL